MSDLIDKQALQTELLGLTICDGYEKDYIHAIYDRIQNAPTINSDDLVKHGEWISVKDRLPEIKRYGTSDIVLAFDKKHGKCFALRYKTREGIKWFCSGTELVDITHWMPLPESPEDE